MSLLNFVNARVSSILCLVLLVLPACSKSLLPIFQQSSSHATATVVKVVDGDTIKVNLLDKRENIRLIGVDTPESRNNQKAQKDAKRTKHDIKVILSQGKKATLHLKSLVPEGSKVYLEFDVEPRDRYGRYLAYIFLPDGSMLNELIVRNGYASPMTYPPNVKYAELFREAYQFARNNQTGLWAN